MPKVIRDIFHKKSKKSQDNREKFNVNKQSSTETRVDRVERVEKSTQSTQTTQTSVDNRLLMTNNYLQNYEIIVKDKSVGTKVYVHVEKIGEKTKIDRDKIIVTPILKITLKYKDETYECKALTAKIEGRLSIIGCEEEINEIAKKTYRHPPNKQIIEAINNYVNDHFEVEEIPIVDYVRQKYPDRLNEIERDPFTWILSHTRDIVGYDRLKLLTLLSIISSQMKRVPGISRIHLNIVGQSGAGKSSVIKSVLKYVNDDMKLDATRFTEKSLGYLDVDTFDGKVVFLEQIDNQNVAYLREAMSEEKICTYVTEKVSTDDGEKHVTKKICIEGQPAFITTSVSDKVDLEREQIANRMLNVYLKYNYNKDVIEKIVERTDNEVSDVDKMVFTAYLLTRPSMADVTPVKDKIIAFTEKLAELTRNPVNRTAEILRNLVRAVAIARGKTKADDDDFNFVIENFQLDILFNGLGLTERDIEFILALDSPLKSSEIADKLKVSKQYAINVLKNLERKGIVEGVKEDGKTFTWYLTSLGRKIKALVNNIDKDVIEVRDEKGEIVGIADAKFRFDNDGRGDKENAVPSETMQRSNEKINDLSTLCRKYDNKQWTELLIYDKIASECIKKGYIVRDEYDFLKYNNNRFVEVSPADA
jgi:DNA-binding MarR family transcriptional regulator